MFKSNHPGDWPSVNAWRKTTRKSLTSKRFRVTPQDRKSAQASIADRIRSDFLGLHEAAIGFYWPIKGEVDLRPLLQELIDDGADVALPVVVEKNRPLEFWAWNNETSMARGTWNIPVPRDRKLVQPTVLLIPLLGFDTSGYRLGYGGGYYDRTLAAFRLAPVTIGVGYEFSRLPTIYPQSHDIPMDAIVTESNCSHFEQDRTGKTGPSSAPCYLHELDSEIDSS